MVQQTLEIGSDSSSGSTAEPIQATSVRQALRESQEAADEQPEHDGPVNMLIEEEEDELLGNIRERVRIRPAMDSGAVANVLHPKDLPADAEPKPNTSGRHFVGANNSKIEKYGSCVTQLESELGVIGCNWQLADVSRPLHSVSEVTGPAEHPTGKQDVLFNNRKCVVVPPGVVDRILKELNITPVAQYDREGNLYLADMVMSTFGRPGLDA